MDKRWTRTVCQSCGMPLACSEDHGTDLGGAPDADYCRFCFREGRFTQPNVSLDDMVGRLSSVAEALHLTPPQAAALGRKLLPTLKRWRDSTP